MAGTRKDIAKLNGPWAPELLWYARGIRELQSRPATDRTSWRYFGAIHGISAAGWVQAGIITSPQDLPPQHEQDVFFDQCQHAGWFFLPWHRGFLAALETVLDDWISAQPGGPSDWALPYWNYLGTDPNARAIPQEFLDTALPDGTPNPLSSAPRSGINALGPQPWITTDIALDAQTQFSTYTAPTGAGAYGGGLTGFAQFGGRFGAVEVNPHNTVHVMVDGWMGDPDFAALDPIFWVHHCNIDRFWEAWMSDASHKQETSSAWQDGPFPKQFVMPNPAGGSVTFTPGDTLPGRALAPTYDNLHDGTGIVPPVVADTGGVMPASLSGGGSSASTSSLVGANDGIVQVADAPVSTSVHLTPAPTSPAGALAPQRLFLNLEGVRGTSPSGVIEVSIVIPGVDGGEATVRRVDTIALFGLAKASSTEGPHAGNGLSVAIDITDLAKQIQVDQQAILENLDLQLSQPGGEQAPISVDRVSVYALTQD